MPDGELRKLVQFAIEQTADRGHSLFRPVRAYDLTRTSAGEFKPRDMQGVDDINRFAITRADAVVAVVAAGVSSLGVPAEIELALTLGKPVVIITSSELYSRSVQLEAWRVRGAFVFTTWDTIDLDLLVVAHHQNREWIDVSSFNEREYKPAAANHAPDDELLVSLHGGAALPSRAYQDDAGLDLAILTETHLAAGEYKMIPTGVRAAVPSGWWGMITGRSSTWAKYRCDVRLAVIDAGYRGELMIGVENRGQQSIVFEAGTRLAQYVLIPSFPGVVTQADQLPEAHRGDNGYGSSGK